MDSIDIPLGRTGVFAIIDAADAALVSGYKWYLWRRSGCTRFYVRTSPKSGESALLLHRVILGVTDTRQSVDHVNCNGLDNRRSNLRLCTQTQNSRNARKGLANTSGVKGVTWSPSHKKWQARIHVNGRQRLLGRFRSIEDAAAAYETAAQEHFGEFARTA